MRRLSGDAADTPQLGAIAAHALDEVHTAVYGMLPEATRVWTDGDAILLVVRLNPDQLASPVELPTAAIGRMVSAAVHRRTGVTLRTGGTNIDAERGLAVLAFERIETRRELHGLEPVPVGPVRHAD